MSKNEIQSSSRVYFVLKLFLLSAMSISTCAGPVNAANSNDTKLWTDHFNLVTCTWASTGSNDFFILQPGYQEILEGREGNRSVELVITVLGETRKIGSIETRIVEEREFHNGQLAEVSRNFFAVCAPANDIFYFGEEVDIYRNGKVVNHEGGWVAENDGARAGLFMPSRVLLGSRFYQELAPDVAMDRVEITSDTESLKTAAGEFHDCVKTEETTPLEPAAREYKVYAKKIGIIQDGDLLLKKYGFVGKSNP
jgi:hypothetical protein